MDLRQLVESDEPYFQFDREERHYAAILFHILNHEDNAELALRSADRNWNLNKSEFGIYLEYSYPRDLWNKFEVKTESNKRKRDVIIGMLASQGFDTTRLTAHTQEEDFNRFFIGRRGSREYVESPANWSLTQLARSLPSESDNKDLVTACMIKWAFRAKPDIVIHADCKRALCIELKLESGESSYPANGAERKLLYDRGLHLIKQTDLQRFLMTKLLGFDCRFRFITRHTTSSEECVSWRDFLRPLKPLPNPPRYVEEALKNVERVGVAEPSEEAESD
jgi:hypothetical protein